MTRLRIVNGIVVSPDSAERGDVLIEDGRILAVGKIPDSAEGETYDAEGRFVCPGFVDIHTHGGGGGDFMDASEESFDRALDFHGRNGTTTLLATSVTAPVGQIERFLSCVRRYCGKERESCRIAGAHLEGPYLSLRNKGAQSERYLRVPERDSYRFILDNLDVVRSVTLAPELAGAVEMIRDLTERKILVSGGHDDGSRAEILPAIRAGLRHCTHLWCAMSAVQMRDGVRSVGLTELGLTDDRLTVEIIADNLHMPPDLVKLVYRCKGADSMCAVSDCLRAGGLPEDGTLHTLGPADDAAAQKFIASGGVGRLPDGSRYAGSIQPLSQMLRNLVKDCGIPMWEAVHMVSRTPAQILGLDGEIGSVECGKRADLCVLNEDLRVEEVFFNGKRLRRS